MATKPPTSNSSSTPTLTIIIFLIVNQHHPPWDGSRSIAPAPGAGTPRTADSEKVGMPSRRVEGEETFAEETTKETGKAKETQYIYIYINIYI